MADERSSRNTRTVDDFRDLPEPARAQAVNFFHEIVQRGEDPGNADHQARELAEKWIRERAPG